ncbi:hypothetical protein QQP08_010078, partial [Theobroma cacao]
SSPLCLELLGSFHGLEILCSIMSQKALEENITTEASNFIVYRTRSTDVNRTHAASSLNDKKHDECVLLFIMAELEELNRIFKELGLTAEKQEKGMQLYEKKAKLLTIAFLIFQGIVLISITIQASSSQCQNWWVPFTLSLLSSLIYILAFLNTMANFFRVQYQLDLNFIEQETVNNQIHGAEKP